MEGALHSGDKTAHYRRSAARTAPEPPAKRGLKSKQKSKLKEERFAPGPEEKADGTVGNKKKKKEAARHLLHFLPSASPQGDDGHCGTKKKKIAVEASPHGRTGRCRRTVRATMKTWVGPLDE